MIHSSTPVTVDPAIATLFENQTTIDIMVTFTETPAGVHAAIASESFLSRTDRIIALREGLIALATRTQSGAVGILEEGGFTFRSLWISNQINVPSATAALVQDLAGLDLDISGIAEHRVYSLDRQLPSDSRPHRRGGNSDQVNITRGAWGVRAIGADRAIATLFHSNNYNHKHKHLPRVLVANIDGGVRHTHEALRDNYLGDWGWFDPHEGTTLPNADGDDGKAPVGRYEYIW